MQAVTQAGLWQIHCSARHTQAQHLSQLLRTPRELQRREAPHTVGLHTASSVQSTHCCLPPACGAWHSRGRAHAKRQSGKGQAAAHSATQDAQRAPGPGRGPHTHLGPHGEAAIIRQQEGARPPPRRSQALLSSTACTGVSGAKRLPAAPRTGAHSRLRRGL